MPTSRFEIEIRAGPVRAVSFNELSVNDEDLFPVLVNVDVGPLTARRHIDDPSSQSIGARQVATKATWSYFDDGNVVDAQCAILNGGFHVPPFVAPRPALTTEGGHVWFSTHDRFRPPTNGAQTSR